MHVRKGDTIVVLSGNDKGKRGLVKSVLLDANRVIVEGVNLRWKHKKPSQKNPKGERVQHECAIHSSNVMFVDPKTGEPTRHRATGQSAKTVAAKQAAEKTAAKAAKKSKTKETSAS
jgi:large subunit ribosomal protein L24